MFSYRKGQAVDYQIIPCLLLVSYKNISPGARISVETPRDLEGIGIVLPNKIKLLARRRFGRGFFLYPN